MGDEENGNKIDNKNEKNNFMNFEIMSHSFI